MIATAERLYTPKEAAALLQVDEQTVRKWLREGYLRGLKYGTLWRVPASEIGAGHETR